MTFFLATRFLLAARREPLARFTAVCAVVGVAAGVGAMIFALAVGNGFRHAMQDKILQNTAHVAVFQDGNFERQIVSEQIKQIAGVKRVTATSFDNALLVGKENSAFAVLRGVDVSEPPASAGGSFIASEPPALAGGSDLKIEIGKNLAAKLNLQTGDAATIISGNGELNENFAPVSTVVRVGGVFSTGFYEYDSTWIRTDLETAARLTGKAGAAATALEVQVDDVYRADEMADEIRRQLGANFKVLDWQEANRPLFAALALERRTAVLVVVLIVLLAALNITTTLALVAHARRADVAVLKTCGARAKKILLIFLAQGAILGAIGAVGGAALGAAAIWAGNRFGLINLPPDVYSVGEIVLEISILEIGLTAAAAFVLSLAASAIPAWTAARIRPHEILRFKV